MEWKRIWHTDWSLWSRLGARIGWFDDDRWRWCIPLLPPHRHTRTFVRAYTRPLPRVTRVSALVVVVVDDGVCGDRLTRRPWDVDPQPRPMGSLLQHDLQRNFVVGHRPRFNQSTCEQQQQQRRRHLLVHLLVNRQHHGGEIVLCRCFSCSSIMKTNTRGPIVDQCEPGHQTVHSTPLIGSSLGMRRWYRFRRPICRAHDRPPSRTTKTATLFTNPATSWQIDVREYVNTLIVVDLSKPQIDWSIDRSDRLPTVSAHSLSLPLFTSTRISSFLPFNFSSRLFEIYSFLCIFSFSFEIVVLVWKIFEFLFKIILYLFLLYPGNS